MDVRGEWIIRTASHLIWAEDVRLNNMEGNASESPSSSLRNRLGHIGVSSARVEGTVNTLLYARDTAEGKLAAALVGAKPSSTTTTETRL